MKEVKGKERCDFTLSRQYYFIYYFWRPKFDVILKDLLTKG